MASGYDGHVSKRQRTDGDDYRMSSDDRHRTEPSPVVHIRGLNDTVTERHLEEALRRFGTISFVMMIPRKHMALVEFEELEAATRCVEYSQTAPINVNGGPAFLNYSNSKKIQRPSGPEPVNRVLLFTVQNPQYPITVDVLHTICSPSGRVLRIVIFKKHGVQCMVEFDSAEGAIRCKDALCGADIYSGCCTLKIEFARPTALNVTRNDSESWDYTGSLGMKPEAASPRQAPLLAEPRYGSAPIAYGQYAAEGSTTPRGTGGYSDYGADTYGGGDPYRPAPQERGYGQHPPADPYSRDSYGRAPLNPPPGGNYHEQGGMGGNPASMYQQGAVLMVYGLNMEKVNCQRLFNLFCLYGNIVRIKFLKSKEGSAMIQMGDQMSCDRAIKNLNNSHMFGNVLVLSFSKQAFLQDVPNPHELPDGSLSFVDYMGTRNNRFTTPDAAQKNRVQPPAKVLHFFNAPPNITEEQVSTVFAGFELPNPSKIKMFPAKSDRSSTGLVEWENKNDSIDALSAANHMEMENPSGKRPYILKLCFSNTPIRE